MTVHVTNNEKHMGTFTHEDLRRFSIDLYSGNDLELAEDRDGENVRMWIMRSEIPALIELLEHVYNEHR